MTLRYLKIGALAAAALAGPWGSPVAVAQDGLYIPTFVYRTGAFAPSGIPIADGFKDYFTLLNERDGGIEGVKIIHEECETNYDTKVGVECYERLKSKGPLVINPYSTGITYALIPKAPVDKIPILSMGYGRTDAAVGSVHAWVFNAPTSYWSQMSAKIKYIAAKEGGFDKLKGKKIAHIFHNSPYGKEPIPTLEALSKKYGFELELLAVDSPGQEQKATWLKVRQSQPDWITFWGWGVMNQVGIKEAAAIGFKMDRMVGVWWSGTEADVIPAGDAAKGYVSATFHAPGKSFNIHAELKKHVYDKNKGSATWDKVGEVLYNRGLVNAMITSEAVRDAIKKHGKKIAGEQSREGLENLNLTEDRLAALGFGKMMKPIKISCSDHEGNGPVLIQQWDGKQWNIVSDWIEPMRDVVRPMMESRRRGSPTRTRSRRGNARRRKLALGERGGGTRPPPSLTMAPPQDTAAAQQAPSSTEKGAGAPMLALNNVEVIYDHVILVLKGVSLTVPKGTIVALLGANGAGKSTTLKAISNLLLAERGKVTKGSVEFMGARVDGLSPSELVRRGCIQVMEGRHCFGHLTVEENLLTGAYTRSGGSAVIKRDLDMVYGYFPRLRERRLSLAGYISGGEQQMVAIGRALMSAPKMVLLDEPSMGLAPQLVEEIFEIVKRLNEEQGVSVLLAEQNTNMALKYATYGYILENGRVVMDGASKSLRENEDVKEFYLGVGGSDRKSFRDVKSYKRRKRWLA